MPTQKTTSAAYYHIQLILAANKGEPVAMKVVVLQAYTVHSSFQDLNRKIDKLII